MYKVHVYVLTDGDFGFTDPEFSLKKDEEGSFYFETRKEAAEALVRSFHNMRGTIMAHRYKNVEKWVKFADFKIELITRKIPTFTLYACFGNQEITYELLETDVVKNPFNGGIRYRDHDPVFDFSQYDLHCIDWDKLMEMPDVSL